MITSILHSAIEIYRYVLLAAILSSWIPDLQQHAIGQFLHRVTEPVLAPVRRVLPAVGGMDFSPLIVFLGLGALKHLI